MTPSRRISAGDTFFRKFFFSGVFVTGSVWLVIASVSVLVRPDGRGLALLQIAGNLLLTAMAVEGVWRCATMKRVVWAGETLRVSNLLREIVVPLRDVAGIEEIDGTAYRVVIRFVRETEFGRRISFSPIGWSHPRPHPIISELQAAVMAPKRA